MPPCMARKNEGESVSETITLCHGCNQNRPLKPFFIFKDAEYWWVNPEFHQLCAPCHAAAVIDRELNCPHLPFWYHFSGILRDYVWPEPELVLKQTELL